MLFTGERVLAGKDGALRNVFSNSRRLDTAASDLQKMFSRRSCSPVEAVLFLWRRRSRHKDGGRIIEGVLSRMPVELLRASPRKGSQEKDSAAT